MERDATLLRWFVLLVFYIQAHIQFWHAANII